MDNAMNWLLYILTPSRGEILETGKEVTYQFEDYLTVYLEMPQESTKSLLKMTK